MGVISSGWSCLPGAEEGATDTDEAPGEDEAPGFRLFELVVEAASESALSRASRSMVSSTRIFTTIKPNPGDLLSFDPR